MRYDTGMTATYGHVNSKIFHFMYLDFKFMPKMPAIMAPTPAAKPAIDKVNSSCPPASTSHACAHNRLCSY